MLVVLSPMVPLTPVPVTNIHDWRGNVVGVRLIDDRRRSIRIDPDTDAEIDSRTCCRSRGKGDKSEEETDHSSFHV
jgi:hypothetical protein